MYTMDDEEHPEKAMDERTLAEYVAEYILLLWPPRLVEKDLVGIIDNAIDSYKGGLR